MTIDSSLRSLLDKEDGVVVDDLPATSRDLRYELVAGRLVPQARNGFHQDVGWELNRMLRPHCPPGYKPISGVSVQIDRPNEPRPDVVVARKADGLRAPVPVDGALVVVEVVSSTSHFHDMQEKWTAYAAGKVLTYLLVDPTFEGGVMLTEFRLDEHGRYDDIISTNQLFTTDIPYPITIDVPALTALRDEYRRAQKDP